MDLKVEHKKNSLMKNILSCDKNPIIAEIKLSSPLRNTSIEHTDVVYIASAMEKGNAVGISILTEPNHFKGSLDNFMLVRKNSSLPLIMKDFIISRVQIDAASKIGADAILLIQALFDREYCDVDLKEMIQYAHSYDIEVLLETHNEGEFQRALNTRAELIGINNRDLRNLSVDLNITKEILRKGYVQDRLVVTESGIAHPAHIKFLKDAGASAFLVGTAIMSANNIEDKLKELMYTE